MHLHRSLILSFGLCLGLTALHVWSDEPAATPETLKKQAEAYRDSTEKVDALAELSRLSWQTNPAAALQHAEAGLKIADRLMYGRGRAACLNAIGVVHYLRGDFEKARPLLDEASKSHEAAGNFKGAGRTAANLGHLHSALSRHKEALACYERAAALGQKADDEAGIATAHDGIGNILQSQGRYREAIRAYEASMDWAARAGDEESRAITLNNLANCQLEGGDSQAALKGYLTAAASFEKLNRPLYQALAYANIAPILVNQGLVDQGRMYLERALKIQRQVGNRPGEATTLLNLGVLLHDLGKTAQSIEAYESAQRIFKELGDRKSESIALHNLGRSYAEGRRFEMAIRSMKEALNLRVAVEDSRGALSTRLSLGKAMSDSGRPAEAIPNLEAGLREARKLEVTDLVIEAHQNLADAYKSVGLLSKAMDHLGQYITLRDKFLNTTSQSKIAEMQTRFESERKEREIQVLQRDREIQTLRIHRQTILRNALLGSLLLLGILAAMALSRYRLKKRSETALQAKNHLLEEANLLIELERDKSEQLLLNVLPPAIAGRLKDHETTIADRYSEATILFADLVGFTGLSQRLDAESLVRMLNDIFTRFDALTDQHGLEKIKTIGDCYMAVGGIPEMKEDHCQAVARMALDMIVELRRFNEASGQNLEIRIGLNTGVVVAGVIGRKKFIYDLWGDAVNTASRMESHGEPSRIHATAAVVERIGHLFHFEERGELEIKGKGRMKTYFLIEDAVV